MQRMGEGMSVIGGSGTVIMLESLALNMQRNASLKGRILYLCGIYVFTTGITDAPSPFGAVSSVITKVYMIWYRTFP